jgi:enolase
MKTFIWADNSYSVLEFDIMVVTAETLKEAQDMMLDKIQEAHGIEREKIFNNKYQDDAHWRYLQSKDDKEERMRVIEECEPIVIECNQPMIIQHSSK